MPQKHTGMATRPGGAETNGSGSKATAAVAPTNGAAGITGGDSGDDSSESEILGIQSCSEESEVEASSAEEDGASDEEAASVEVSEVSVDEVSVESADEVSADGDSDQESDADDSDASSTAGEPVCGCCGGGDDSDDEGDGDPLVSCVQCGQWAHAECLRLSKKDTAAAVKNKWKCDLCVAGIATPKCHLCPNTKNRCMRKGKHGSKHVWCHITCTMWVPEVHFDDPEKLLCPIGFKYISADRYKLKCRVCKVKNRTAPIQCAVPTCVAAFHPLCAREQKWQMEYVETPTGQPRLKAYCEKHSEASPDDIQCEKCGSPSDAEHMLLCDECDKGYHMACLDPPLTEPPADDEDWFCPPCVQVQLLKGAIVQVQEPVAGAGGAGSGAGKRRRGQVTTTRTRYLALTDEFVASLPAPPALVSSDEEDGGSDDSGSEAGSMFADSGSEDDNTGTAADDGNTRSRKRARTGAAPGGKADTAADPSLGYFMAHRGQSAATSGATLAGLPMFDAPGELVQVLRGVPKKHVAEVAVLKRHYRQRFPLWGLQLAEGFNLLFYGLGSKRTLLQEFVAHAAGRHAVVEVNGYMPWFSMKKLLTTITSKMLWHNTSFSSILDQAHFVANCFGSGARRATASAEAAKARALQHAQQLSPAQGAASNGHGSSNGTSSSHRGGGSGSGSGSGAAPLVADDPGDADWEEGAAARQSTASRGAASTTPTPYSMSAARGRRLYLLIHNLDGPSLRSPEVQTALSVLAGADRICVTASVDHVNSALLMDQRQRQRGNWLWHDVTTYAPYLEETAYMESVLQSRKELNFDRLSFVLQSLTPNHRAVLRVLAQHHVDDKDTAGMLFRTYCQACMDNMLVSSDQGFRGLMVELQDHDLVAVRRGLDNRGDTYYVPFSDTLIARMLDLLVRWKDA